MYFSFKFIFYVIFLISPILGYDPPARIHHNSVIINNQLLIFAGWKNQSSSNIVTDKLIYLDLLKPFEITNLSWTLIPDGNLPIYTWFSTAIVGLNNSTIFQIGGYIVNKDTLNYDFSNQVHKYDYNASKWTIPSITGDSIPPRQQIKGVIDNSGIIYIFGGVNTTNLVTSIGTMNNDMNTFDTSSMAWKTLNLSNLPLPCNGYSASLLPNGIIVYIGGQEIATDGTSSNVPVNSKGRIYAIGPLTQVKKDEIVLPLVNMKSIKCFDTKKLEWSYMNATGDDIDSRFQFSSVLTSNGHIIIFGGIKRDYTSVSPNLAILDTNKSPYHWSIPNISKFNSPPSIYGHSANLYFDYMIITFGYSLDDQAYNSQVYLYNITGIKWVTTFSPFVTSTSTNTSTNTGTTQPSSTQDTTQPSSTQDTTQPRPQKNSSKTLAIGLGTGISLVIVIFAAIFIFISRKKAKTRVLKISGSNDPSN
ncbi:hypothetical protein Glove_444g20 [Diversispora epigaea]|uniref:Galactose oxidase n=1 Tax=Diversispora epigaea TaxID=1348612 RepID=A0A397GUV9_9GLOM|nr:hypothetical protein Glove_444g20 [Diversispora epigaea]